MEQSLGRKLKELRINRGLSLEELAEKLNERFNSSISKGMISKWENGISDPRLDALRNMAIFFDVSMDDLLGIEIDPYALTPKEERDIAKRIDSIMADLESDMALAYNGEPLDDEEDREALRASLENTLRLSKYMAKKKFTPNKYRK